MESASDAKRTEEENTGLSVMATRVEWYCYFKKYGKNVNKGTREKIPIDDEGAIHTEPSWNI